jgi:hypothetical protein
MITLQPYLPLQATTKEYSQPNIGYFRLSQRQKTKTSTIEKMGSIGSGIAMLGGLGILTSPLLSKKAVPLTGLLVRLPGLSARRLWLEQFLSGQKKVEGLFWRVAAVSGLFGSLNNYQTAINTKQPSLLVNNISSYIGNIGLLLFPQSALLRAFPLVSFMLLATGKRNDIDNSNHPEYRREWDIKRLHTTARYKGVTSKQFKNELKEFLRFIGDDLKQTFSIKPWQELKDNWKKKENTTKPQPYLTSIAGQLFALSFIAARTAKKVAPFLISFGGIVYNLPIYTRAWQNRSEPENRAMLLSIPTSVFGDSFRASPSFSYLAGLSTISGVTSISLKINSKRYKAMLDYLDRLYHMASKNPSLKAQDVFVELSSHKPYLKALQQQMGKNRVDFLLELLHDASLFQRYQNLPLSEYLRPIVYPSHQTHTRSLYAHNQKPLA